MSQLRHFLDIDQFDGAALRGMLDSAKARKDARAGGPKGVPDEDLPLAGKVLAMVFIQPSTRTRVSFDIGMRQLGGQTIVLNADDLQLDRGETMADTGRVLSRYVDAIMLRTKGHEMLEELVAHATVPVINGLTDASHPCQLMADVMTLEEHRGDLKKQIVAWSGDGNNVATSWIHGAAQFGYEMRLACPEPLSPSTSAVHWARENGANIIVTESAEEAVSGADCIVSDAWVSMHDDDEAAGNRHNMLAPYQVNAQLMSHAKDDAVFMHCLPVHRGEEVTAEIIDGPRSLAWDEAENRLHAQKGILTWCLG
ncbi:MAG: ornithine carbamoyltransferase [Rhodospirillaceae bacterium]|mgnify:FL=1|jgi:ornithine carbamoyltransferase|nr:ornithine carbamoyltransferase [Rhodospirillaceae bacterium]MBT4486320.1 ornithine carbamoyltransferase [Rhodospirillaceae bacterium]MBT5193252.1 ornithine carbamoyltransferase [Rhodospirillaceae bacterium]MBT5896341.1 ornithine carbamoyltransferase [Rhodospirillaceae bacterium]MBT6426239.1 ornithine carbamoyltransferase [Rhodospirillaceae bacterium]